MSRARKEEGGPAVTSKTATPVVAIHHNAKAGQVVEDTRIASRQLSWWSVHEWVQPFLDAAGDYPWPGTPAWCELADDDRRKWAGLLDFAQHHALRVDTAQQAHADASGAIAASTNWAMVATEVHRRRSSNRIEREVA
ncbi:DUF2742 domain-containing protein [Mycolicibacillus trivialis]|uniref:DUF2742 domain-containing protein n=1 Tax=Mycolicibacillus trivialis TaxID=1798 RepID=UPI000A14D32D|nr:DUF2742 domain-containing protein [Mycolicibacillus trivialis]